MSGEEIAPAVREAGIIHGIPCSPGSPLAGTEKSFLAGHGGYGRGKSISLCRQDC